MNEYRFIIASENPQNLKVLTNVINKLYPNIVVAQMEDGLDAWKSIEKYDIFTIFISTYNTASLNAFQVLKKIQESERNKKLYSIFISEKSEKEFNIKIISQGFDDYFSTPFAIDEIVSKLKSAVRVIKQLYDSVQEQTKIATLKKELVEFRDRTFEILKTLQKTKFPDSQKLTAKFKDTALFIAGKLDTDFAEMDDIGLAADLCLMNKMFLTDSTLRNPLMTDGHPTSELVHQAQNSAGNLIALIWGSDNIAKIISHIYENFDGTGFPTGSRSWEIPIGSRILRVLLDYEELILFKKLFPVKALEELDKNKNRIYDPSVICLLDQYSGHINNREKTINISELKDGMVLSRNIITNTYNKIIGAGTTLTDDKIQRLVNITESDPVLGDIYIEI